LINIARRASDGFFQRVAFVSSFLSKYAIYANLRDLSSSVKFHAQLTLLHTLLYFEQSCKKIEPAQWFSELSRSDNTDSGLCSDCK
jgi:hypothetical protein